MKKCPKCGAESESKFCPDCGTEMVEKSEDGKTGKDNKPSKKSIGCAVIIIILILIGIMSCGGEDEDSKETKETKATTESTQAATTEATKATTEAKKETKAKFNPDDYKNIAYNELARNPQDYEYQLVRNSGRVIQVIEGGDSTQLRVAIDDDYDKVVLLEYDPSIVESRILEDDYITYYGMSAGVISYESTLGGTITVPGIYVTKIKIN